MCEVRWEFSGQSGEDLTVQHQCVFLEESAEEAMLGLDLYG